MKQTIDIDGQKLAYEVCGEGRPIVLMHGWGCQSETLASVAKIAAETHKVYSVDFPGFGLSPEPPEIWGVHDYTRLIEKFIARLGLEKPSLLGHSFGGRVGILYASRNDVDKLILVDAAGIKPRRPLKYYLKVYSFKAGKMLYRLIYGKKRAQKKIELMRAARGSADYAAASPMMRRILSKVVNEDLKHVLPLIKAPTLLIWGENDTATPLRDAKTMAKLIPDAGLVSFPDCGHYSFLDNPYGFSAVLSNFLKS